MKKIILKLANLIQKIIRPVARWSLKHTKSHYQEKKKSEAEKKEQEFYKCVNELYKFAKWLNNNFPNRKSRKSFWRSVSKGEKLVEQTMKNMLERYKKNDKDTSKK